MNHDATHCFDYDPDVCPKECYRAQLTKELKEILYFLPTSWANYRGTKECSLENNSKNKKGI